MRYSELTPELERELVAKYQAGDRSAGADLLEAHWPILRHLVQRLMGRGVEDADVTQTACAEFLNGALRWDRSPDVRLTSWASQCAFYKTKTAVWKSTTIKVSEHILTERTRCRKRGEPVSDRLAMTLDLRSTVSLDASANDTDDEAPTLLEDTPSDEPGPESRVGNEEATARRLAMVIDAMGTLDARDREILRRRYMVDEPESLSEIGDSLGVTRSRVDQLCKRAKARFAERVRAIMSEDDAILWGGEWRQPERRETAEAA